MQHREEEAKVSRDRPLEREQRLDRALDGEEELVDLVVEGDHLIGQLDVPLLKRANGAANRRDDALALLLKLSLEPVQSLVDRHGRHRTCDIWLALRAGHHFVTTPQQPRIPPSRGGIVPWPRTPKEERTRCRRSAL